jgi:arginase
MTSLHDPFVSCRAMIDSGLPKMLGKIGWRLKMLPPLIIDPPFGLADARHEHNPNAKNCYQVGQVSDAICNYVHTECLPDNFPLILGGDHCISIGTISAIRRARPQTKVVWVDAHGDINTPATSGSGNMHGMPLAFLLGLVKDANAYPGFKWFTPCLDPQDIVYIGLRDLDEQEKSCIKQLKIKAYTMYDVDRLGIGRVMEEAVDYIGDSNVHLSFDIDAIDPFFAPHTGTAVTGGLSYREGNYICEALAESTKLSSMELVEVDPSLHQGMSQQQTIGTALTLIGSAMGLRIL